MEDEHDGSEPDNDGEPSLGAFEGHGNQDVSYAVSGAGIALIHDAELDGAELGIADQDGLGEQVPPGGLFFPVSNPGHPYYVRDRTDRKQFL